MTTSTTHWSSAMEDLNACREAVAWARTMETPELAWAACTRGDWMLWIAGGMAGDPGRDRRRILALAACECARLALPYVRAGERRPLIAIETAERWARGDHGVTMDDVRRAAAAAAYAERTRTLAACADIVRKHYPSPPILEKP